MLLHNTENLNILVVGDIMLDHYMYGDCNRISPEAPVPVVEVTNESHTLGGAGNVVENLNALCEIYSNWNCFLCFVLLCAIR